MKQIAFKKFAIAALMLTPSLLFAQDEKKTEKKERQQITITRTGDKEEKMVVEIDGDKVKVNGKDVADLKDVQVRVNNMKTANVMALRGDGDRYVIGYGKDGTNNLYKEDANRAMLGVVTDAHDKGAEIESVTKESAAEKAGLKKGDVITKIDAKKIDATEDVTSAVKAHKPGDKIVITYLRDDKEQKTTAELGKWKGVSYNTFSTTQGFDTKVWNQNLNNDMRALNIPRVQMNNDAITFGFSNRPKLGLSVQDTDDGKGVKVLDADGEGNAAKAGIKEGDIITHIDDKAVNSADEISSVVKEKKDQATMRFQITRGGKSQNIEVKVPRKIKTVDL